MKTKTAAAILELEAAISEIENTRPKGWLLMVRAAREQIDDLGGKRERGNSTVPDDEDESESDTEACLTAHAEQWQQTQKEKDARKI